MFTVELRKVMPLPIDYIRLVSHLLIPIANSKLIKDDIQNGGVFEFLFEMCLKCDDPENSKNTELRVLSLGKIVSIGLLKDLWILFPYKFEVDATIGNAVLSLMKRSTRQSGFNHKFSIYSYLTTLLAQFASDRNPYAAVVYKILVFSLIENYKDGPIREFLSKNLQKILQKISTLPVNILVEPLMKQMDLYENDQQITMHDIELLRSIVTHPRLALNSAIVAFNTISKLFLSSFPCQQCFSTLLIGLLRRHIEDGTFCEYAVKFASVTLAAIYKSFKQGGAKRLDETRRLDNVHRIAGLDLEQGEIERELGAKHWRALATNTLRDLVLLRAPAVNGQLQDRLLFTNREVRKLLGRSYDGILALLAILCPGVDPKTAVDEYDREMKAVEDAQAANKATHNAGLKSPDARAAETEMYRRELGQESRTEKEPFDVVDPDKLGPVQGARAGGRRKTQGDDNKMRTTKNGQKSEYGSIYKGFKPVDDFDDLDAISQDDLDDLNAQFGGKIGLKNRVKAGDKGNLDDKKYKSGNIKVWQKDGGDHRVRKHLEELKKKKEDALNKQHERELSKKLKEEKVNKQLEGDLQWRKKVHPTKETDLFLDLNLGEMYIKGSKPNPISNFIPIDPIAGSEETLEKEHINILLLKHRSALQYLFKRYANSIPDKANSTFDLMGKRASSLSLPELNKLLSDYFITEFTDKDEIAALVKLINEGDPNQKNLKFVDYDGFLKLLTNLAMLIHTREPISMQELSYSLMFQSLLDMIDKGRRLRGEENPNFGPQNSAKYLQEKDMIDLMNFRLQENPEFVLPPSYRKVREKKVNFEYSLPVGLLAPHSYKDCYEIVADLLKDIFEFNMVEPQAKFFWTVEAQPREDLFETDLKAIKEYKDKRNKDKAPEKNRNLIQLLKPDPEAAIKKRAEDAERAKLQEKLLRTPASFQVKSREEFLKGGEDPAHVGKTDPAGPKDAQKDAPKSGGSSRNLSNDPKRTNSQKSLKNPMSNSRILDVKNAGSADLIPRSRTDIKKPSEAHSVSVKDSAAQSSANLTGPGAKQVAEPPKKQKTIESATLLNPPKPKPAEPAKPTVRQQQLEADLRRMKVLSEMDKSKPKPASPSPDDARRKEEAEERRKAKLKEEVKAYKEKLLREEKERKDRELREKETVEREKRERSKVAMRDRKKELEDKFADQIKRQKEKSEETKKRIVERMQKEDKVRKEAEATFKNDREKMIRDQQFNEKITSILNSGALKPSLMQYEPQLQYVFKHYINSIEDPTILQTNLQNKDNILHFRNFMNFAYQFNFVPAIVSIPEMKVMYLSCTKHLELDDGKPIGLDFKAFTEMLLRIAIKKQKFFKEIDPQGLKSKAQDASKERESSAKREHSQSLERSVPDLDSQQVADFSNLRHFEDAYTEIDTFSPNTFAAVCDFLDLPAAKTALATKLNSLRRENVRTKSRMELVKTIQRKYGLAKNAPQSKSPPNDRLPSANDPKPALKPAEVKPSLPESLKDLKVPKVADKDEKSKDGKTKDGPKVGTKDEVGSVAESKSSKKKDKDNKKDKNKDEDDGSEEPEEKDKKGKEGKSKGEIKVGTKDELGSVAESKSSKKKDKDKKKDKKKDED
jgi:hypothetical protein